MRHFQETFQVSSLKSLERITHRKKLMVLVQFNCILYLYSVSLPYLKEKTPQHQMLNFCMIILKYNSIICLLMFHRFNFHIVLQKGNTMVPPPNELKTFKSLPFYILNNSLSQFSFTPFIHVRLLLTLIKIYISCSSINMLARPKVLIKKK